MSWCLVADDAAVIQVTRVISIQSQTRGVIEMTTTERRRNKKHHNSGVAIIYIDKKYDHLNLHTYTTAERAGGWWGRIIIICMLLYVQTAACMQEHVHVSYYMSTWTPRHHPWSRLPGSLPACCIWHTAWNEGRPLAEQVHTGCPETGTRRGSVCGLSSSAVSAWHNNCSIIIPATMYNFAILQATIVWKPGVEWRLWLKPGHLRNDRSRQYKH